jgi:hypothetical protein
MGGIIPKIRAIDPDADPAQQSIVQQLIEGDTKYYNYFQLPDYEPDAGKYQVVFRPDAHPEGTSVDGWVYQGYTSGNGVAWATLVADAGNDAIDDDASEAFLTVLADGAGHDDKWRVLSRGIFLFDTSPLPDNCTVTSAVFSLYGTAKADPQSLTPNVNVYASTPTTNTALVGGDYDSLGATAYCDTPITYANWNTSGWNNFYFNATGLAAIAKTGITKLGVRNVNYDVDDSAPSWTAGAFYSLSCCFADYPAYAPKLTVNYTVYGQKYLWIETDA